MVASSPGLAAHVQGSASQHLGGDGGAQVSRKMPQPTGCSEQPQDPGSDRDRQAEGTSCPYEWSHVVSTQATVTPGQPGERRCVSQERGPSRPHPARPSVTPTLPLPSADCGAETWLSGSQEGSGNQMPLDLPLFLPPPPSGLTPQAGHNPAGAQAPSSCHTGLLTLLTHRPGLPAPQHPCQRAASGLTPWPPKSSCTYHLLMKPLPTLSLLKPPPSPLEHPTSSNIPALLFL